MCFSCSHSPAITSIHQWLKTTTFSACPLQNKTFFFRGKKGVASWGQNFVSGCCSSPRQNHKRSCSESFLILPVCQVGLVGTSLFKPLVSVASRAPHCHGNAHSGLSSLFRFFSWIFSIVYVHPAASVPMTQMLVFYPHPPPAGSFLCPYFSLIAFCLPFSYG